MFLNGGARTSATPPRAWFSYKEHTPPHRGLGGWVVAVVAGWRAGWLVGWLAGLAGWLVGWLAGWLEEDHWFRPSIVRSFNFIPYLNARAHIVQALKCQSVGV